MSGCWYFLHFLDEPGSCCYSRPLCSPLCSALHLTSARRGPPPQGAPAQARGHARGTAAFLLAGCSCLRCPAVKWQLILVSSFLSGSLQTSFTRPPRRFSTSPSTPAPVSLHLHSLAPLLWAPRGQHSLAVPLPQEVLLLSCPVPAQQAAPSRGRLGTSCPGPSFQLLGSAHPWLLSPAPVELGTASPSPPPEPLY